MKNQSTFDEWNVNRLITLYTTVLFFWIIIYIHYSYNNFRIKVEGDIHAMLNA